MSDYTAIPGFENVYLEDSWVLGIRAEPGTVFLDVEIVLKESHPSYTPPPASEKYCYRRGVIRFDRVSSLNWTGQGAIAPAFDAAGERDFGSIDRFQSNDEHYTIAGDFGLLQVTSSVPEVHWSL